MSPLLEQAKVEGSEEEVSEIVTENTSIDWGTHPLKARVFISCGQLNDKEKDCGFICKDYFGHRGFSTYLAETVQSLQGLTDNIFYHLRNSEYAVFIDHERENLNADECRGSVFVNQELAIATFLQIESRVFHEGRVKREGVANYIIAKPIHFKDKSDFLKKLAEQTESWSPNWRNELSISFFRKVPNVITQATRRLTDWYHLQVRNNHPSKVARNCVAYILLIKNLDTGEEIIPPNFELLWSGTFSVQNNILPQRSIEFDAFLVFQDTNVIGFRAAQSSSTQYVMPEITTAGNYLFVYTVISDNFERATKAFKLRFGGSHTNIDFTPYDEVED